MFIRIGLNLFAEYPAEKAAQAGYFSFYCVDGLALLWIIKFFQIVEYIEFDLLVIDPHYQLSILHIY